MSTKKAGAEAGKSFDGEIIAEIQKNSREVYRVMARSYKGHRLADVRVWFDDPETGEPRPGKGVSLKVEALPEIINALAGMVEGGQP